MPDTSRLTDPAADRLALNEPDWAAYAVWWHVYPLGFVGADTERSDPFGEPVSPAPFDRITAWLDYVVELGVSGILLGPIFASQTHGYDTVDYRRIDPRLGDDAAFDAFIGAANQRGIRVLLDGVFNHVGREFDVLRRALDEGPGSVANSWFRRTGTTDDGEPVFDNFEGHHALVALDHAAPVVADFVVDVMSHWLARGIDGWRLDAAYSVPEAFWAEVLPRVRADFPGAYVVGEVIHGDYPAIVSAAGLDSVTQYELWKAIENSIESANFFELDHALGRHNGYLQTFAPLTFVGNHDVTRLASVITDERHLAHALVALLTVGGTPAVYYGDEQGFRGIKEERFGGDDAIRPAFPSEGRDGLAPDGWPVFHLHQELIGLRRRHPWLHRATTTTLELTNTALVYESRFGDDRLIVVLNLGETDAAADVPGAGEVLAGAASVDAGSVTVPAHGWAVLRG